MKKFTKILSLLIVVVLMSSCKKEQSLQSYLVESQDKTGFVAVDVPSSVIKVSQKEAPEEIKKAIESIKKVNIVALPIEGNEDKYETEKDKLKSIFSNSTKYKNLVSVKDKRGNANLYYLGNSENIDEVIVFGFSKKMGLGVVRLLGDNMNPSDIMKAFEYVNVNMDENVKDMSKLIKIFDGNRSLKINTSEAKATEE